MLINNQLAIMDVLNGFTFSHPPREVTSEYSKYKSTSWPWSRGSFIKLVLQENNKKCQLDSQFPSNTGVNKAEWRQQACWHQLNRIQNFMLPLIYIRKRLFNNQEEDVGTVNKKSGEWKSQTNARWKRSKTVIECVSFAAESSRPMNCFFWHVFQISYASTTGNTNNQSNQHIRIIETINN